MGKLSDKQQIFIREYLVDHNATQAAIRAGYSKRTADRIGHQLLKKLEIQDALTEAMLDRSSRLEITADDILRELWILAKSDPTMFEFADGMIKTKEGVPEEMTRAVASVKIKADGHKEFRLWSKPESLKTLVGSFETLLAVGKAQSGGDAVVLDLNDDGAHDLTELDRRYSAGNHKAGGNGGNGGNGHDFEDEDFDC